MDGEASRTWVTNLIIAGSVILAVIAAIMLAQLDGTQHRSNFPVRQLPMLDLEATIAAGELSIVYLPPDVTTSPTITTSPEPTKTPVGTIPAESMPVLEPTCSAAPPNWKSYNVKTNDSLSDLAIRYGVSVMAIVQANCLTHERIIADQTILLPQEPIDQNFLSDCGAPPGWEQYVVGPGDNLLDLARARGTKVLHLMKANCLETTFLMAGRKLFLPPQKNLSPRHDPSNQQPTVTEDFPETIATPTKRAPIQTPMGTIQSTKTPIITLEATIFATQTGETPAGNSITPGASENPTSTGTPTPIPFSPETPAAADSPVPTETPGPGHFPNQPAPSPTNVD